MSQIIVILIICSISCWFLTQRKIAESANKIAQRACQQQNVQFISCYKSNTKFLFRSLVDSGFYHQYQFEFSSRGEDLYQGHMIFKGLYFQSIHWPVFNEPTWDKAPQDRCKGR
tara:strand:- start:24105 stop:24446 length:342 start_codon:yes stop_codon:yes gene_type:complete